MAAGGHCTLVTVTMPESVGVVFTPPLLLPLPEPEPPLLLPRVPLLLPLLLSPPPSPVPLSVLDPPQAAAIPIPTETTKNTFARFMKATSDQARAYTKYSGRSTAIRLTPVTTDVVPSSGLFGLLFWLNYFRIAQTGSRGAIRNHTSRFAPHRAQAMRTTRSLCPSTVGAACSRMRLGPSHRRQAIETACGSICDADSTSIGRSGAPPGSRCASRSRARAILSAARSRCLRSARGESFLPATPAILHSAGPA
jgi:hypothetical protein